MRSTIYGLVDPRNGEIRYVGQSVQPKYRCFSHYKYALKSTEHTYKLAWIRVLARLGMIYQVVLIQENVSNPEMRERYWIKELRRRGHRLTNETEGGERGLRSKAVREKLSEKLRKNWKNPDYRKKMLAARDNPDAKKRIKDFNRTFWTAERRAKHSNDCKNARRPEARKKISEKAKKRWADPKFRERVLKNLRNACRTPEFRAKSAAKIWTEEARNSVREKARKRWQDPVYRARVSKKISEGKRKK